MSGGFHVEIAGPVSAPDLSREFDDAFDSIGGRPAARALVGGRWRDLGDVVPVSSPIDGSAIGASRAIDRETVEEAIEFLGARRAALRAIPAHRRAEMLLRVAEVLGERAKVLEELLVVEAGKPRGEARGEVEAAVARLRLAGQDLGRLLEVSIPGEFAGGTEDKRAVVVRVPVGVTAAITPFNYPLFSPVSKIGPALLAGNPVIFKPSSNTPLVGAAVAAAFAEAGFSEFLAMVSGPGGVIGDVIVSHPIVRAVTFTGSSEVGRRIARVAGVKRLHLELGGKAPAIVLDDADVKAAAERIAAGSYRLSGQRCDAVSRVIALAEVADALVDELERRRREWRVGDPRDEATRVGPLIDRKAVERVEALVSDASERGAKVVGGGRRWNLYFEPTLLDGVPLEARIAWEETFGPVIPVIRAASEAEAVEIANRSDYGLDAAIFTSDVARAWRLATEVEAGEVTVNDFPRHGLGLFPFGGVKDSGLGREGVGYSVEELTELRTIVFRIA
ncbi:MAG: aldehyde dehydrogenase family protein [Conexivisphaera sp.]